MQRLYIGLLAKYESNRQMYLLLLGIKLIELE